MHSVPRVNALVATLERREIAASRPWILAGFGRAALEAGLTSGRVVRVLEGQYAHRDRATETLTRASAAATWLGERGVVGGPTAAFLLGIAEDPRRVHVVCRPRIHTRGPTWMKVRHRAPERRVTKAKGVEIACAEDAAIQTWEHFGANRGARVVIECVRRSLANAESIATRAKEYPTLRQRQKLMGLLADLHGGIDSFLELQAARTVFVGGPLRNVRRHARLRTPSRDYVADFFYDQARLAIETDGRQFHSSDLDRRRDLARDADLSTIGVQTLRFTYEDIMNRPEWCREVVISTITARLSQGGATG